MGELEKKPINERIEAYFAEANYDIEELLLTTVNNKDMEVIRFLLNEGSDVNYQGSEGWTALMVAAAKGQIEMVKFFLQKGADIDLTTDDRETALHLAIFNNKYGAAVFLINAGADTTLKDYLDRTPLFLLNLLEEMPGEITNTSKEGHTLKALLLSKE